MSELTVLLNSTKKMSSLEIAELMEKEHRHVMRDIRNLIDQEAIGQSSFGLSSYQNQQNKEQPMYQLDFPATMLLITGYDPKRRALVIDRWLKLETGEALPALANSSAIDAMAGQIIAMVVPAVISQVMEQVQPMVQAIQNKLNNIQINFSHAGTVWSFHYHCCQAGDANSYAPKDELYAAYRAYCDTKPCCQVESKTGFLSKIYRAFMNSSSATITTKGRKVHVVRGLVLLPGYRQIIEDLRRERQQLDADELARRRELYCGIPRQSNQADNGEVQP